MDTIPAALKQAEIARFIHRANQLRQVKPAITYWCEYWAVKQILAKQLHTADDESLAFTTGLMDRLEQMKTEHPDDDAIIDDTAGQAYVEQFAQQTFDRCEKVLQANKVTRQTADTFDAAATFFQLIGIWEAPDEETQQKIKFAKWNAARILRAIKEGKDPNESNPKRREEEPTFEDSASPGISEGHAPLDHTTDHPSPPPKLPFDPIASPLPSHVHQQQSDFTPPSPMSQASPINPPDHVPSPFSRVSVSPANSGPTQPPTQTPPTSAPALVHPPAGPSSHPLHFASPTASHHAQPPTQPSLAFPGPSVIPAPSPHPQTPSAPAWPQAPTPQAPHAPSYPAHPPPTSHPRAYSQQPPAQPVAVVDEVKISQAQKHAKWAISALNFDDVPTAVKELRKALETLGAQ
ncbi:hypothetical protein jhhlp_005291 [Lomentospora prolificans]|uniref:Vta1 C-terminal domain-containing protein n=1 Tax=Lomentospora prolificans TaxID=41688 RepID=A0A2N3N7G6_9PEZI|nr:hypothetical protein jhhlp_005291 [Lomentospora prolificans]